MQIFQDAKICLCGREPDLKHQRLRVLPEQSVDTYLRIL